jgi:hypothetical protein
MTIKILIDRLHDLLNLLVLLTKHVWVFDFFLKSKFNYNLLCKFRGKIKLKKIFGWLDFLRQN